MEEAASSSVASIGGQGGVVQVNNIQPLPNLLDWLSIIPCAVCTICKRLIGKIPMESEKDVDVYVHAIQGHYSRKHINENNNNKLKLSRAELRILIRQQIALSRTISKVQILKVNVAPIDPLPLIQEPLMGFYCPCKSIAVECSYCCLKENSMLAHLTATQHGTTSDVLKSRCKVQMVFGGSYIRVKDMVVTQPHEEQPQVVQVAEVAQAQPSRAVGGREGTRTTTTTSTGGSVATASFSSYLRYSKLLSDSSSGAAIKKLRSYHQQFGWDSQALADNIRVLKQIRYTEPKEGDIQEDSINESLDSYMEKIEEQVQKSPLHCRTIATAGIFGSTTGASITSKINLNVEAVTAKKYFNTVKALVFFLYRLAAAAARNDSDNQQGLKKLGITEDIITRTSSIVNNILLVEEASPPQQSSTRNVTRHQQQPQQQEKQLLLASTESVKNLLVKLYKDDEMRYGGQEPLVLTFLRCSSVDQSGAVVSAEVIHKISVALLHSIKKLVVVDVTNSKNQSQQEEITHIASSALVFRTLVSICKNIQAYRIQQNNANLPSEHGPNALAFGTNVLHYGMLPILANNIIEDMNELLIKSTFGMKLPDVAYFLSGSTNNAAPIVYAGEYDFERSGGKRFIRYTPEILESKFINHLISISKQKDSAGSQYTIRNQNTGEFEFRVSKLVEWNQQYGNKINLLMAMMFMFLGGGIPRCSEVIEAKYHCQGDSGYHSSFHVNTNDKTLGYLLYHNKSKNVELHGGVMRYLPQKAHTLIATYIGLVRPFNEFCSIQQYIAKHNSTNTISSSISALSATAAVEYYDDVTTIAIQNIKRSLFLYDEGVLISEKLRSFFSKMASAAATKAAGDKQSVTATVRTVRQLSARSFVTKAIPYCSQDYRLFVGDNPSGTFTLIEMAKVPWVSESIARIIVANHSQFGHTEETHQSKYDGVISASGGGIVPQSLNLGYTASRIMHFYLQVANNQETDTFYPPSRTTSSGNTTVTIPTRSNVLIHNNNNNNNNSLPSSTIINTSVTTLAPSTITQHSSSTIATTITDTVNYPTDNQSESSTSTSSFSNKAAATAPAVQQEEEEYNVEDVTKSIKRQNITTSVQHLLLPALYQMLSDTRASFTSVQLKAIDASLKGEDLLLINSTGSGKSLCYQLPLKVCSFEGRTTILVVPSVVLVNAALSKFSKESISCVELNRQNAANLGTGLYNYRVIVTTPEALCQSNTAQIIGQLQVSRRVERIVIDEAHIILTNDPSFRSAFVQLKYFTYNVPVTLLTATLPPSDIKALINSVGISDRRLSRMKIIRGTIWRENIGIGIIRYSSSTGSDIEQQKDYILSIIKEALDSNKRAIIYCMSINQVENIYSILSSIHKSKSIWRYHSRMESHERNRVENLYVAGTTDIIIATSAFGVGVHSTNIELVLILQGCYDLYEFAQYIGRVARGTVLNSNDGQQQHPILMKGQVICIYDSNHIQNLIQSKTDSDHSLLKESIKLLCDFQNFCESAISNNNNTTTMTSQQCIKVLLTNHFDGQQIDTTGTSRVEEVLDCISSKSELYCSVCCGSLERFENQFSLIDSAEDATSDSAFSSNPVAIYKAAEEACQLINHEGYCIVCLLVNGITGTVMSTKDISINLKQKLQSCKHLSTTACPYMKDSCLLCTQSGHQRNKCTLLDNKDGYCFKCGMFAASHAGGNYRGCNLEPLAIRLACVIYDGKLNTSFTQQAINGNILPRLRTNRSWVSDTYDNPKTSENMKGKPIRNYVRLMAFWYHKMKSAN